MKLLRVSRANAVFGYGPGGEIREIADVVPDHLWQHPQHAWSPLIKSTIPGLEQVFLKYEGSHLSGSFKDRIMSASLSEMLAKNPDCPGVVVPSSGNAAVSAAALCAGRKLPMIAIVPLAVPVERLQPIVARGGIVVRAGEGPSQSYELAHHLSAELGYEKLYSTFASPWAEWGCRALGLELAGQMSSGIFTVLSPVSAGPVLVGTANGLLQAGRPLPQLIAVQAAGCAPISEAFANGALEVTAWSGQVDTKAAAIADRLQGYAQDGTRVLEIVRQSHGRVDAVTDAEMASARAALLQFDGIDAEFSSCAGVALLMRNPQIASKGTVCIITASGFKHTFGGDVPVARSDLVTIGRLKEFLAGKDSVEVLG